MTTQAPPQNPPQSAALTRQGQQRMTLRKLFDQQKPELAQLLPQGMSLERFYRMALTECVKNPTLLECSAASWALAMQTCVAQGLYPNSTLGFMYLVPRKVKGVWEVQAQRGYQGDIELVRRSGELGVLFPPEVVYEKDHFKVVKGLSPSLEHVPYEGDDDPGKLRAVYAVCKLKDFEDPVWVVLMRRDVERHKKAAQGTDSPFSPWNQHTEAMWQKTAIHVLFKWVPKATEVIAAAEDRSTRKTIDVAVEQMGRVELPPETPKPALEAVTERLRESGPSAEEAAVGAEPVVDVPACPHADVPTNIPPGQEITCKECGEVLRGEPAEERQPGEDDDELPPATEGIKALAAAADQKKATGKQRRLEE